jgi:hypothetical protein
VAWCGCFVFSPSAARCVLRLSFSEERASSAGNEHWCGAAKRQGFFDVAKMGFLFQLCTLKNFGQTYRKAFVVSFKLLI